MCKKYVMTLQSRILRIVYRTRIIKIIEWKRLKCIKIIKKYKHFAIAIFEEIQQIHTLNAHTDLWTHIWSAEPEDVNREK